MAGAVVPAIIAARMRHYKKAFRNAGAINPATAIRPADIGLRENFIFDKLVRRGILVAVGDGRIYLDEARDETAMRTKRKLLAVLVFIILLFLIGSAVATWRK